MIGSTLHNGGLVFALGTAVSAGILAALAWNVFRGSPIGFSLAALAGVMSIATLYHTSLLLIETDSLSLDVLGAIMYLSALAACYSIVQTHRQIAVPIRGYRRYAVIAVVGGIGFAIGGFVSKLVITEAVHWVHGGTALLICIGLYGTMQAHFGKDRWIEPIVRHPAQNRSKEWMRPLDDAILELLSSSDLVLTPSVIGINLGYSREEVNRRIRELESRGYVTRIERGKYKISTKGQLYFRKQL
jgi:biotin operon repressor